MTRQPLFAAAPSRPHPLRAALGNSSLALERTAADPMDELRLFFTAWLGGMVFFGTFLA